MATFSLGSAGNVQDLKQVKSYLYKLEEQLKYMFANLDPEENFDSRAKLIYAANAERQAALEVALEGITASYVTKETLSQLALTEDQASLRFVNKDGVVSAINASSETVSIDAGKITLNGYQETVINSGFRVTADGKMHSVGGEFEGALTLGKSGNTGQLIVKDSNNAEIGRWDNTGISIKKGEINGPQITVGGNGSNVGAFVVRDSSNAEIGRWDLNGINIKKGSLSLSPISGTSKYAFTVSSSGARTTNRETATGTSTTIYPYMELAGGVLRGGVDDTWHGSIQFSGSLQLVDQGPYVTAMALRSNQILLAGGVYTCDNINPNQSTNRGQGQTVTFQNICSAPILDYDQSQDDYDLTYTAVQMVFVNGILTRTRSI